MLTVGQVDSESQATGNLSSMPTNNRYQMPDLSVQLTDELIMQHIERGSRVIDLGCGDGRLMQRLRDELGCTAMGRRSRTRQHRVGDRTRTSGD